MVVASRDTVPEPPELDEIRDRDAILLWQVAARGQAVLEDLQAGRSPGSGLASLNGFLLEVVTTRIADQDRELYPLLREARTWQQVVDRLEADHRDLTQDVEDLAAAAEGGEPSDVARVALLIDRLVRRLERHLLVEASVLAATGASNEDGQKRASAALRWRPRTEGLST